MPKLTIKVSVVLLDVEGDEITVAVSLDGKPTWVCTFLDDEGEEWKYADRE